MLPSSSLRGSRLKQPGHSRLAAFSPFNILLTFANPCTLLALAFLFETELIDQLVSEYCDSAFKYPC